MIGLDARLPRRRFLAAAGAMACAARLATVHVPLSAQATGDVVIPAPFFAQGSTGKNSSVNCGPATVAAAVNYSGVAFPSVYDVRATIGANGPTTIGTWAWLLNWYGVPWHSIWSRWELDDALRTGHVVVVAAWMRDLSSAPDFEEAWSAKWGQSGRYDRFDAGHALLIVGTADGGLNYVVHDPNVFSDGTYWYGDGSPKGAYRKYNSAELWATISDYAKGQALAVAPPPVVAEPPKPVKRVRPELGEGFNGPAGGHSPIRVAVDPEPDRAEHGALPDSQGED